MDKKSILKEIKKLINFSGDKAFKDAKLVDGETIIHVDGDTFEVGQPLHVVTPDGMIPAPAGEHITQDGVKIVVDEAGIITSVEEVAAEAEAPVAEMSNETEDFYTWDACMVDMMQEYGDEQIASAVCGKIKADGYIMSKEEALNEGKLLFAENASTEGATASEPVAEEMKKKYEELEARIAEVEKMMTEMLPMMKETAEFGNEVINKIDSFVKETPAENHFASIKSEYKKLVSENKTGKFSSLESIKNVRKK